MAARLVNKVAVVTGGGSGIGRAVAVRFLHEGAKVVVCGRTAESLDQFAAESPLRAFGVTADVTDAHDLHSLATAATRRFGNIDVLAPAAGCAYAGRIAEITAETATEFFQVNVIAALQTVRVMLPHMNDGGAIQFLTAAPRLAAVDGLGLFSAAKAALGAAARALAVELAPRRIRVNCIALDAIDTPLWRKLPLSEAAAAELHCSLMTSAQAGGRHTPSDVAEVATFLASEATRRISGQEFVVGVIP